MGGEELEKMIEEAHGWNPDRPRLSNAEAKATPRDHGHDLAEKQRLLALERTTTKEGVRAQFECGNVAEYKGHKIILGLQYGGYRIEPEIKADYIKNWTAWYDATDAIDREVARQAEDNALRQRAKAVVDNHVREAVTALGGEIRSRQIQALMQHMYDQEYRLLKLEARLDAS